MNKSKPYDPIENGDFVFAITGVMIAMSILSLNLPAMFGWGTAMLYGWMYSEEKKGRK